mgnify:CR=1 FL=1
MTRDGETFFFKGIVYESIIENIKNGKVAVLNTNIYDFTEITSGITVSSYTSQHSSSTADEYGRKSSVATRSCDSNVHVYIAVYWPDFDQLYSKQL